ncbi:hypothetical protein AB0L40_06380 [Patulibacter sp. NPDC049589]|uniref:hypothetical protein n=1 Tax=Patulibacter sp. NPDC049589 TaxID=3154731 RepID=UPI0034181F92
MPFVPLVAVVMMVTTYVALKITRARLRAQERRENITVGRLVNHTGLDAETGAVYSIQTASITTPTERLDGMWSTHHLERLARSYWLYMERFSLGLVRVHYDDRGRYVCFLSRHIPLLGFKEPEYEFGETLGVVRWPIDRGLLISRKGRGRGYLEIEVHRRDGVGKDGTPLSRAYVELEVSGFYPTLNSGLAYLVYKHTQSRYHVLLAYGFMRSLARADLAPSKIGRFAAGIQSAGDEESPERIPRRGRRRTASEDEPTGTTPRGLSG